MEEKKQKSSDIVRFALVEDEAIEREGLALFIRNSFPEAEVVWTAADGEAGLERVEEAPPDVLIVDIEMPVMNGLQLCEELKKRQYNGVILIHTAYAKFSYARKAVALNVYDYLLKPMEEEDMRDTLKRCIEECRERGKAAREKEDMERVVQGVKQYTLSLMALDSRDERQKSLFLETVGWSAEQDLQAWVIRFSAGKVLDTGMIRALSEQTEWIGSHGFLVSSEYFKNSSYLLFLQPKRQMDTAKLYTLIYIFLSRFFRLAPGLNMEARGPANSFESIAGYCRNLIYDSKMGLRQGQLQMPARTWKILSGKDVEKFSGNLNRYIRDGDMDRARRQIDRLCISAGSEGDAVFWEIVPVCLEVIYDIWTQGVDGDRLWSDLFETECTPAKWLDLYFKELSERPQDGKGDALESLLSWMEEQYAGDISLQMAAKRMGMDQSYFSRYFKKQTGKNFSDKLMEIRLRHCEEILQSSPSISLDELTIACGFHSKSYFCEVFRKWKGMTVTQYVGQKE